MREGWNRNIGRRKLLHNHFALSKLTRAAELNKLRVERRGVVGEAFYLPVVLR